MLKVRTAPAPAGGGWVMPLTGRELAGRRNSAITNPSVGAWPRRDRLHVARQGVEMHRAIVETGARRSIHPHECVLQPVEIVALRKILTGVRPAALGAVRRRVDGGGRLQQQVLELERLDKIAVPDQRAVAHPHVGEGSIGRADALDSQGEGLAGTEHRSIALHGLLHLESYSGGTAGTV